MSVFPREIERFFFEIMLTNSKSMAVRTIYRPANQSNFSEIPNENMNNIDSINDEIYILGDFNINLFLDDSYIS